MTESTQREMDFRSSLTITRASLANQMGKWRRSDQDAALTKNASVFLQGPETSGRFDHSAE